MPRGDEMTQSNITLKELEQHDDFISRHIGPRDTEIQQMLGELKVRSLEELMEKIVPDSIRDTSALKLPSSRGEKEVIERLRNIAKSNQVMRSMIGCGYYDTVTPNVIVRNVLENPSWYTAYTPYQPEISQGRLEAVLNFQTMVSELTGMSIANASLLDEASAAARAGSLLVRGGVRGRRR